MDFITSLGIGALSSAAGNILSDITKSNWRSFARGLLTPSLANRAAQAQDEVIDKALIRSLCHFIELFRSELQHTESLTFLRECFEPALKVFLKHPETLYFLSAAFDLRTRRLEVRGLSTLWAELQLPDLPNDFDWEMLSGGYLREVRKEVKHTPALQAILNADNLERTTEAAEHMAGVIPGFDLAGYRDAILSIYEHLKLDTLDISGQDYRVRLRKVFIPQDVREALPVYELPKDVLRRLQNEGAIDAELQLEGWEHHRRRYLGCPLISIEQVLNETGCHHFVVLGDAGSGKSSLAQNLLLEWADNRGEILPFLVELRAYAQDVGTPRSFLEYLESGEGCPWHFSQREMDDWLRTHKTLVIFEGLDEIFDSIRRHETARAILRFASEYPKARIMATSRTIGYDAQDFRNAGFRHFTLQGFSEKQVQQFLTVWHNEAIASSSDRQVLARRLQDSLSDSASLQELAGNPLLLTMLAVLNRNQELPRDRAEAYAQMSRVLLYQWDVNKFLREHGGLFGERVGRHEKEEMLRRIAMTVQRGGSKDIRANLIPRRRLEQVITEYLRDTLQFEHPDAGSRLMIRQLQERNFVLCQTGADYFSFVHRTFLEFYCASAFVEEFYESLSIEQLRNNTFSSHWRDESWREVLKLITGMLPEVHSAKLIESLLQEESEEYEFENVFLAAECWRELSDISKTGSLGRVLWHSLVQAVDFRPARSLYPRIDLTGTVIPIREAGRIHALEIRTRAIAAFGAAFSTDRQALSWLRECAVHRSHWALRQAAIRTLSKHWKAIAEVRQLLSWAARPEEDENVRIAAVQAIARDYQGDSETVEWLRSLVESDSATAVRSTALRELARGWADDLEIQTFVQSINAAHQQ